MVKKKSIVKKNGFGLFKGISNKIGGRNICRVILFETRSNIDKFSPKIDNAAR